MITSFIIQYYRKKKEKHKLEVKRVAKTLLIESNTYSFRILSHLAYNSKTYDNIIWNNSGSDKDMTSKLCEYLVDIGITVNSEDKRAIEKAIQNKICKTIYFENGKVTLRF